MKDTAYYVGKTVIGWFDPNLVRELTNGEIRFYGIQAIIDFMFLIFLFLAIIGVGIHLICKKKP